MTSSNCETAVTDPNKPDQKPAGPKPADESKPSAPYISARLREKLEESTSSSDDWSPKAGSPLPGIIAVLVVIGVGVGGVMWLRAASQKEKAKEQAAAAMVARADSIATAAAAESLAVEARADSVASAAADSVARAHGLKPPSQIAAEKAAAAKAAAAGGTAAAAPVGGGAAAATPEPVSTTDGFGIAVGTYMDEGRAQSELERLSGTTGLSGKVGPTQEGGETVYRVILGKFGSRGPANARATALADSGLVREARVVARPR